MVSQRIGRCSANKIEKILIYFVSIIFFLLENLQEKRIKAMFASGKQE